MLMQKAGIFADQVKRGSVKEAKSIKVSSQSIGKLL